MTAKIINFPRKQQLNTVKSIDLYYCWDIRLNHPLLNSLFKSEISYVERWYLQTQHLLNSEQTEHPIIKLLMSENDDILNLLINATNKDLAVQHYLSDFTQKQAAEVNIKKLNRWLVKWQCLLQYRQKF